MQNEQEGPVYWFDQDDLDKFGEYYLKIHRVRMEGLEILAYADFGRYIAGQIRQKTEYRDLEFIRYAPISKYAAYAERICAWAVIKWEVFNGPADPDTERSVREGILL